MRLPPDILRGLAKAAASHESTTHRLPVPPEALAALAAKPVNRLTPHRLGRKLSNKPVEWRSVQ